MDLIALENYGCKSSVLYSLILVYVGPWVVYA